MKTRIVILSAALALVGGLAGCGEDLTGGLDSGTAYAISAGTFNVTNATAVGEDQCGLLGAYQAADKTIGITDDGGILTFNLSNDPEAPVSTLPTAVLDGNAIDQPVEANYTVAFDNDADGVDDCTMQIRRNVVGDLVADNTAALTLTFDVAEDTGTCDTQADGFPFAQLPCASQYTFTATHAQ